MTPNKPEDRASDSCCPGLTDVTVRVARLEADYHDMRTDIREDIKALHAKIDATFGRLQYWMMGVGASLVAGLLYIILGHGLAK